MAIPLVDTLVLTASYQALAASTTIARVTITAPSANAGAVTLRANADDDQVTTLEAGQWEEFVGVDLALLQAKGTVSDELKMVGEIG